MPKSANYIAVIGDLVASRSMSPEERQQVQERFQAALDEVNQHFSKEIAALFLITVGDEAQGLLKKIDRLYAILRQIQIKLFPAEIVFGVGVGTLTTEVGEFAIGADGPAFHRARQALTEAKSERKEYGKAIVRDVKFLSENPVLDPVVNALFLALAVLRRHWTEKQTRVLNWLEQGKAQKEVSEMLEIALSNVNRTIESTNFREYEQVVEGLQAILSNDAVKIVASEQTRKR